MKRNVYEKEIMELDEKSMNEILESKYVTIIVDGKVKIIET